MILLIALWVIIALNVLSICLAPFMMGKPRKPVGPGFVLWALIYGLTVIASLLYVIFEVL